jgi:hypothetical protein
MPERLDGNRKGVRKDALFLCAQGAGHTHPLIDG